MKILKWYLYRLKWHLAPYINFSAPVHVDIELTSRCNLKCTFCHQQDRNYEIGDMDIDMLHRIIDECTAIGVKSVKFNWRGESTLYKDFDLILSYAKRAGLYVYMNTNLSRQYYDRELKAIACHVDVLKVSIDTMHHNLYSSIRIGARLTKTISSLIKLAEYRQEYKKQPLIISRRTISGMESDKDFKRWFKMSPLKFKFDISPAMPRNPNMENIEGRKRKYCGQPSRRLVIGWDGKTFPCCVAYNEPSALFIMGAKQFSIKEIWEMSKELIPRNNKGLMNIDACRKCTSKESYK